MKRNQYAAGRREIQTEEKDRLAFLDWFDRLPVGDPARANRAVSWMAFKIRRAQRNYETGVQQVDL